MKSRETDGFEWLKGLILKERAESIKRILRQPQIVSAFVVDVSEGIGTFECKGAGLFESGDVIGQVLRERHDVKPVGTVIDSGGGTMTVFLFPNATVRDEQHIQICEIEPLISYDLQTELIDRIRAGGLAEQQMRFVELVFEECSLPELRRGKLNDVRDVKGGFSLDDSQIRAVESILALDNGELLLIIGPPGTGKTRVIAKASYELMKKGERILIASHTNRAVDNALENLPLDYALRVGRPEKVLPHLKKYLLSYKARLSLGKWLEDIESHIEAYKRELRKIDKSAPLFELELRKKWKRELRRLYEERNKRLKEESEKLIKKTPIIGSTLVKSQLYPLRDEEFDVVFIDECSQASITLALLGMIKGKRCVLVGDHKQLLPVFKCIKHKSQLEQLSAFCSLRQKYEHRSLWLERHYRSNSKIIGFSAKYVYQGKISPVEECKGKLLKLRRFQKGRDDFLDPQKPVVFINVEGSEEKADGSRYNEKEIEACEEIVKALLKYGVQSSEIGIISPYRAQRKRIAERLDIKGLEVNTVDAFQGREKDVIIFSVTSTEDMAFASDINRLNVAFTRPRYKLIVVGNGRSCYRADHTLLRKFLEYAYDEKAVWGWREARWLT
jgi:superfamily I DNA and/or RNA helicase